MKCEGKQIASTCEIIGSGNVTDFSRSFDLQIIAWGCPGGTEYKAFQSASFSTQLEAQIRRVTWAYFQSLSASYPTLDSLAYRPGRLALLLQMTAAKHHPNKSAGFQSGLKVKGPASNLRASKKRPWVFIFVVLETAVWDSKVEQYVLGLSQKDVWGALNCSTQCLY